MPYGKESFCEVCRRRIAKGTLVGHHKYAHLEEAKFIYDQLPVSTRAAYPFPTFPRESTADWRLHPKRRNEDFIHVCDTCSKRIDVLKESSPTRVDLPTTTVRTVPSNKTRRYNKPGDRVVGPDVRLTLPDEAAREALLAMVQRYQEATNCYLDSIHSAHHGCEQFASVVKELRKLPVSTIGPQPEPRRMRSGKLPKQRGQIGEGAIEEVLPTRALIRKSFGIALQRLCLNLKEWKDRQDSMARDIARIETSGTLETSGDKWSCTAYGTGWPSLTCENEKGEPPAETVMVVGAAYHYVKEDGCSTRWNNREEAEYLSVDAATMNDGAELVDSFLTNVKHHIKSLIPVLRKAFDMLVEFHSVLRYGLSNKTPFVLNVSASVVSALRQFVDGGGSLAEVTANLEADVRSIFNKLKLPAEWLFMEEAYEAIIIHEPCANDPILLHRQHFEEARIGLERWLCEMEQQSRPQLWDGFGRRINEPEMTELSQIGQNLLHLVADEAEADSVSHKLQQVKCRFERIGEEASLHERLEGLSLLSANKAKLASQMHLLDKLVAEIQGRTPLNIELNSKAIKALNEARDASTLLEQLSKIHTKLSELMDEMECELGKLDTKTNSPEKIMDLIQSVNEHIPSLERLENTRGALFRICSDNEHSQCIRKQIDSDKARFSALQGKLENLQRLHQNGNRFSKQLDAMLSDLCQQVRDTGVFPTHPAQILVQIQENELYMQELLESWVDHLKETTERATEFQDPQIAAKIKRLNTVWVEICTASNAHGKRLEEALIPAREFWELLPATMTRIATLQTASELEATQKEVDRCRSSAQHLTQVIGTQSAELQTSMEELDSAWDNITTMFNNAMNNEFLDQLDEKMNALNQVKLTDDPIPAHPVQIRVKIQESEQLQSWDEQVKKANERVANHQDPRITQKLARLNSRWEEIHTASNARLKRLKEALTSADNFHELLTATLNQIATLQTTEITKRDIEQIHASVDLCRASCLHLIRIIGEQPELQTSMEELDLAWDNATLNFQLSNFRKLNLIDADISTVESQIRELEDFKNTELDPIKARVEARSYLWANLLAEIVAKKNELEDIRSRLELYNRKLLELLSWLEGTFVLVRKVEGVASLEGLVKNIADHWNCVKELEEYGAQLCANNSCVQQELTFMNDMWDNLLATVLEKQWEFDYAAKIQDLHIRLNKVAADKQNGTKKLMEVRPEVKAVLQQGEATTNLFCCAALESLELRWKRMEAKVLQRVNRCLTKAEIYLITLKPVSRNCDQLCQQISSHNKFTKGFSDYHQSIPKELRDEVLFPSLWEEDVFYKLKERTRALHLGESYARDANILLTQFHGCHANSAIWIDSVNDALEREDDAGIARLEAEAEARKKLLCNIGQRLRALEPGEVTSYAMELLAKYDSRFEAIYDKLRERASLSRKRHRSHSPVGSNQRKKGTKEVTVDAMLEVQLVLETMEDGRQIAVKGGVKLFPLQIDGIQKIYNCCFKSVVEMKKERRAGCCLLADEMGLGKTLQVIALIHTLYLNREVTRIRRILVLCPKAVCRNWTVELEKWLALTSVQQGEDKMEIFEAFDIPRVERMKRIRQWTEQGGVAILNYDGIAAGIIQQKDIPDLIVCDEAHIFKTPTTDLVKAMKQIGTPYSIMMTGTPFQNDPIELFQLLATAKCNLLGEYDEFRQLISDRIKAGQDAAINSEKGKVYRDACGLLHQLISPIMVRRGRERREKRRDFLIFIPLTHQQQTMYTAYIAAIIKHQVKNPFLDHHNMVAMNTHPKVVIQKREQDGEKGNGNSGAHQEVLTREWWKNNCGPLLDTVEISNKMIIIKTIIQKAIQLREKVLIFSQYIGTLEFIGAMLEGWKECNVAWGKGRNYMKLDGECSANERQTLCKECNDEYSNVLVFLVSKGAGCEGLNMHGANRVIIVEPSWNPALDTQAIHRADRCGQKKTVYVYRLVAEGTVEQRIVQHQISKTSVFHRVVDNYGICPVGKLIVDTADVQLYQYIPKGPPLMSTATTRSDDDDTLSTLSSNIVQWTEDVGKLLKPTSIPALSKKELEDVLRRYLRTKKSRSISIGVIKKTTTQRKTTLRDQERAVNALMQQRGLTQADAWRFVHGLLQTRSNVVDVREFQKEVRRNLGMRTPG